MTLKHHAALLCISAAAGLMLLSGCGGKKAAPTEAPTTEAAPISIESETVPEKEEVVSSEEEEDIPPEPGLVRSALTHEWIPEELAKKRPLAVMYPIDRKAQPQYGLDRVSVFYEILEEGSMSRQLGILEDWEDLGRIGNIRSIRDYFIYEALEWDSVIVHFGGPELFVKDMLNRPDVDNINGVDGVMGSSYGAFYRIPAGSKSEHTAYTDGKHILSAIEKANFSREHREEYWQPDHWKFAKREKPVTLDSRKDAVSAENINMAGSFPITGTTLKYNTTDKKYYRSIYGAPQKDAVTGTQLAFENVLIESATSGQRGGSLYLYFHVLDYMHKGWFMTGGKMIPVSWVKNTDYEPTRFYDADGEEITLNTGKTMVFICQEGQSSFTADGVKYEN